MRDLTPEMLAEFEAPAMQPVLLAEMAFDSQSLYMWTGVGTISWQGQDYIGAGNFIGISTLEETQNLEAKGIVCTLNGIPSELVAVDLLERSRGRPIRIWLGAIDTSAGASALLKDDNSELYKDDGSSLLYKDEIGVVTPNALVVEPYRVFTGLMDVIEMLDDAKTAVLRLSAESTQLLGTRAKISRYTAEDQKKKYPNDKGLDLVNRLQDKQVVW